VRPMPRLRTDSGDPVHLAVTPPAVEQDVPQLPLEFGLRAEEFHAEALRRGHEPRLVSRIDLVSLLNHPVSVHRPFGDGGAGDYWLVDCAACESGWQVPHYAESAG
jgi:hypothetical protein